MSQSRSDWYGLGHKGGAVHILEALGTGSRYVIIKESGPTDHIYYGSGDRIPNSSLRRYLDALFGSCWHLWRV